MYNNPLVITGLENRLFIPIDDLKAHLRSRAQEAQLRRILPMLLPVLAFAAVFVIWFFFRRRSITKAKRKLV